MNTGTQVAALEAFALKHYEEGGHWVYETFAKDDYLEVLAEANGNMDAAMRSLKDHWNRTIEQQRECRWD